MSHLAIILQCSDYLKQKIQLSSNVFDSQGSMNIIKDLVINISCDLQYFAITSVRVCINKNTGDFFLI